MSKTLFGFILAAMPFLIWSQDILEPLAEETCSCVNDLNFETMNADQIEMNFGLCVLKSINDHQSEVEKEFGKKIDYQSPEFSKLIESIGGQMAITCPDVIMKLAQNDEMLESLTGEEIDESYTVTGKITNINQKQFYIIDFETEDKVPLKFIFLYDVENSDIIRSSTKWKGQKLSISYIEMELYDGSIGDFRTFKILDAIEPWK